MPWRAAASDSSQLDGRNNPINDWFNKANKYAKKKTVDDTENEEQSCFYNLDDELMLAYRYTSSMRRIEICMPIVLPPTFTDDDPLVAPWAMVM